MSKEIAASDLRNQIQLGKDLAKAKEYEKAEKIFVQILKTHQLADVHNALGMCYADTGNFNAAEYCFKEALKINPNYMEAALNLSVLYNNLGKGKESKEIYKKLTKYGAAGRGAMDPLLMQRIANYYGEIGNLYNGVGEYKLAIAAYEQALDLCPQFLDIQTKLGTAYREAGQKTKALKLFEKAKRKAGKYAPFWVALGVTYYAANKPREAKKAWEKAKQIEPKNLSARAYLQLDLVSTRKIVAKKQKARSQSKKKRVSKKKKTSRKKKPVRKKKRK